MKKLLRRVAQAHASERPVGAAALGGQSIPGAGPADGYVCMCMCVCAMRHVHARAYACTTGAAGSASSCLRALELADELEQAEALRGVVRVHFRNGERAADAIEEREGATETARVALAPVDGVDGAASSRATLGQTRCLDVVTTLGRLLHEAVGGEIEVHALRRVHNLLAVPCRRSGCR